MEYAPSSAGALQPDEDQQIIDYLADTQTPEAAAKRKAEADAAASSGKTLVAVKAAPPPVAPAAAVSWVSTYRVSQIRGRVIQSRLLPESDLADDADMSPIDWNCLPNCLQPKHL